MDKEQWAWKLGVRVQQDSPSPEGVRELSRGQLGNPKQGWGGAGSREAGPVSTRHDHSSLHSL